MRDARKMQAAMQTALAIDSERDENYNAGADNDPPGASKASLSTLKSRIASMKSRAQQEE